MCWIHLPVVFCYLERRDKGVSDWQDFRYRWWRSKKEECEENCDYSDASAAIKLERLEWEAQGDCSGLLRSYCNALFWSCTPDYKIGEVSEDVFKCYYPVDTQLHFFCVKWCTCDPVGYNVIAVKVL